MVSGKSTYYGAGYPYSVFPSYANPYSGHSPRFGAGYGDAPPDGPDRSSGQGGPARGKPAPGRTARVTVRVPADAELWFDEATTKSTGRVRRFVTPELAPDREFTYEVRARWHEDGRLVTRTRKAVVTAGADVEVDFTAAPAPAPMPKAR